MNIQELSKRYVLDVKKLNKMHKYGLLEGHQDDISYMSEILNLESIGLDYEQIAYYLNMNQDQQIDVLNKQRVKLLNHIHEEYKKIDLVDYLLNQKKEG